MKTSHTPGPWFINGPYDFESDLFIRATIDGENYDVASTYDDETGQALANAKLIAAAPKLLKVLQELVEDVHGFSGGSDSFTIEDARSLTEEARAIIKEATE